MEQEEHKPKWLLELENRKLKQRLGHETGAGAPCLTCESACPGLDLHFWRKICKNCKCRGDEHDFDDDEFPQFELLFGPNVKNKKSRSTLLKVNNKKQAQIETSFEWVPPNTTRELAADYMNALPSEKMPIKGSSGAVLRKQQLQKQLPLHDIDHKTCDELSEQERKEFEKYLDNLKQCVGQGKVSKLITVRPFDRSLMTPANATDVQQTSPQHSYDFVNPNGKLNLRTPSCFIPKMPQNHDARHDLPESLHNYSLPISNTDITPVHHFQTSNEENPRLGIYHPSSANFSNNINSAEIANASVAHHSGLIFPPESSLASHELECTKNPSSLFASEENTHGHFPNFDSPLLKGSKSCSDKFCRQGELQTLQNLNSNINEVNPQVAKCNQHSLLSVINHGSLVEATNVPGTHHLGVDQLTGLSTINSDKNKLLYDQLNRLKNFNFLAIEESDQRNKNSQVEICSASGLQAHSEKIGGQIEKNLEFSSGLPSNSPFAQPISSAALAEMSDRNYGNKQNMMASSELEKISYQPSMSNSENVKRNAERVQNFENSSEQYKSEDKGSSVFNPQYTVEPQYLQAEFHTSLPVQSDVICSKALNIPIFPEQVGISNIEESEVIEQLQERIEGMAINAKRTQECHKCQEDIRCNDVVVTAEKIKDAAWHPGCFVCTVCNELLVDLVYFTHKGELYCGRDLAELLEIPRCFACDELIFVREYTVAEGHNYHVKHFCCWDCDIPLAGQHYVTEDDRPLCLPCYQKNYANTCNTCTTVINADQQGVTIKNLSFHATDDCFCCVTCKKSLFGAKVAIKENKLLCSKECIAEFLHRRALGR